MQTKSKSSAPSLIACCASINFSSNEKVPSGKPKTVPTETFECAAVIICFANWSFGNSKDSTYTSLAKFMNQAGVLGISKWLHGFYPKKFI